MSKYRISNPKLAIFVIIFICVLLAEYGIVEGAAILFTCFAGTIIYKIFNDQI